MLQGHGRACHGASFEKWIKHSSDGKFKSLARFGQGTLQKQDYPPSCRQRLLVQRQGF